MPTYPVRIIPGEEGRVLVTFPDVPEAVVCAESEDAAMARAPQVLEAILCGYLSERRPIPYPSEICGAPTVGTALFEPLDF
ncbi:MAG TPA: type II toxin-antitoxin system HicB family antitoxin [Allosphingosinicella sp.]|jgi:antitoxin HicB